MDIDIGVLASESLVNLMSTRGTSGVLGPDESFLNKWPFEKVDGRSVGLKVAQSGFVS